MSTAAAALTAAAAAAAGAAPQLNPPNAESSSAAAPPQPKAEPLPQPPPAKKGRTNTPWTPQEEQRLKVMRDQGKSWSEIAKVSLCSFWIFLLGIKDVVNRVRKAKEIVERKVIFKIDATLDAY